MSIVLTNKQGKNISYNSKAKSYRYYVDGEPKSSVTTDIGKRMDKGGLIFWTDQVKDQAIKRVMTQNKVPLDEINDFLKKVKQISEDIKVEARDIGSTLHEWIDMYLKKKNPPLPSSEPLKTMCNKWLTWWQKQKFEIIESELPIYSSKSDIAGCTDAIVTKPSWKGQKALLDWKSSKDFYLDQVIQVETYKNFIEESTNHKIHKIAIVNIPKDPNKDLSMMVIKSDNKFYKGFKACRYLNKLDEGWKKTVSKFKKEIKRNV